jgi:hypothetical protein
LNNGKTDYQHLLQLMVTRCPLTRLSGNVLTDHTADLRHARTHTHTHTHTNHLFKTPSTIGGILQTHHLENTFIPSCCFSLLFLDAQYTLFYTLPLLFYSFSFWHPLNFAALGSCPVYLVVNEPSTHEFGVYVEWNMSLFFDSLFYNAFSVTRIYSIDDRVTSE